MKSLQTLVISALFTLLSLSPACSVTSRVGASQDFGLGSAFGQPMGVTAKYWLDSTTAIDGFAGMHFNDNFDVHADYLWHTFSSFNVEQGRLPFFAGVGGRVLLGDSSHLGARFPVGASYLFGHSPVELYAEVAPVLKLIKKVGFDMDGHVGLRVYLNYLQ